MSALEIWGGPECTVHRIGDRTGDQLVRTGHHERLDDIDRFADLGLRAIRYPVLWERTEVEPGVFEWCWPDARLDRLGGLGLRPIVGLIHHGSGPAWTNLLDQGFACGLARFAGAVARRYPWVQDWTPVNEPLTTARFSALYGFWHPHERNEGGFWNALLNQIEATVMSMAAIRAEIPHARLIQTEDFGHTYATVPCQSQADFENLRRFMTWDLLVGRVDRSHPFWARLDAFGLGDRLRALADAPCPPQVLGLNHYLTSDRFLDHRVERYPTPTRGGNDLLAYADVEAVRVLPPSSDSWRNALTRVWDRYGAPMAITECHLGGPVEDQCQWLHECRQAALDLEARGAKVEGVTVWSLLGAYDWDSLLTADRGHYEAGAFDVSSGRPFETALADLVRRLTRTGHEVDIGRPKAAKAWWKTDDRVLYPLGAEVELQSSGAVAREPRDGSCRHDAYRTLGTIGPDPILHPHSQSEVHLA